MARTKLTPEERREHHRTAAYDWYIRNREKCHKRSAISTRKYRTGVSEEAYEALSQSQNGKCAICHRLAIEVEDGRALAADHDHVSGRVRGLLCRPCNTALGLLADDASRLRSAIEYLKAGG